MVQLIGLVAEECRRWLLVERQARCRLAPFDKQTASIVKYVA